MQEQKKLPPWCKRAKIAMIRRDISVEQLAEELGYTRNHLSSALNGKCNNVVRKKVSSYLDISDSEEELKDEFGGKN